MAELIASMARPKNKNTLRKIPGVLFRITILKLYATAPDSIKRSFNQAIFGKVLVLSEGELVPELADGCKSVIHAKRQNKKRIYLVK